MTLYVYICLMGELESTYVMYMNPPARLRLEFTYKVKTYEFSRTPSRSCLRYLRPFSIS